MVEDGCDNSSLKFHWVKDNHKRGWFADPFILRLSRDEITFLVEEFIYKLNRGVISKLVVDRSDFSIKSVKIILDTGSHLSFPAYYRKNGKVYIYPESGQRGATYLYEYDEQTDDIRELYMINPNVTADTTLAKLPIGPNGGDCPKTQFEKNGSSKMTVNATNLENNHMAEMADDSELRLNSDTLHPENSFQGVLG